MRRSSWILLVVIGVVVIAASVAISAFGDEGLRWLKSLHGAR